MNDPHSILAQKTHQIPLQSLMDSKNPNFPVTSFIYERPPNLFLIIKFSSKPSPRDDYSVIDEYNSTKSIKSNEVGILISSMDPHMYNSNENFSIVFYTRNKHFKNTKYASTIIPPILKIYEKYFNQVYPHSTIKYLTVPNSDTSLCEIKNGMILSRWVR